MVRTENRAGRINIRSTPARAPARVVLRTPKIDPLCPSTSDDNARPKQRQARNTVFALASTHVIKDGLPAVAGVFPDPLLRLPKASIVPGDQQHANEENNIAASSELECTTTPVLRKARMLGDREKYIHQKPHDAAAHRRSKSHPEPAVERASAHREHHREKTSPPSITADNSDTALRKEKETVVIVDDPHIQSRILATAEEAGMTITTADLDSRKFVFIPPKSPDKMMPQKTSLKINKKQKSKTLIPRKDQRHVRERTYPLTARSSSVKADPAIISYGRATSHRTPISESRVTTKSRVKQDNNRQASGPEFELDEFVQTISQLKKGDRRKIHKLLEALRQVESDDRIDISSRDAESPTLAPTEKLNASQQRSTRLNPEARSFDACSSLMLQIEKKKENIEEIISTLSGTNTKFQKSRPGF